jgi:hypothetical protein
MLLFQSPRPLSTYENTYVLEPNVQRFTVAKICNSVVPQLYKGLFYEDPPLALRPRPGTSQNTTEAKTALFAYLLDACNFKREVKWGMENKALFGTAIYKWGIEYVEVERKKRKAAKAVLKSGPVGQQDSETIITDDAPDIERTVTMVPRPFFEHRPLDKVLVDPKVEVGDIRKADFVVDIRYMDYYQMLDLQKSSVDEDGVTIEGWDWPADLQSLWMPNSTLGVAPLLASTQATYTEGVVLHSEQVSITVSPDLLLNKVEVMEYWDKKRKILVLDRKKVLFTGDNPFKKIPFLSSNWWNRPKAFYGMGLGLIVGQNQRVDQGTINAILKILSFGVNPVYLRSRDANSPTQMIRTGLGKMLTVDGDITKAYKLMETPRVPPEVWQALQENQQATESSSGADQMLVQGSTAGPRSSMGRTAGGAATLAGASATRLDGPLDNFIEQVFEPFLYILDELVFEYIADKEIVEILGEEVGKELIKNLDMQDFWDSRDEFEVLAGASLAAKKTMAQSLTLITQIFENPQIQESLAENQQEYIDYKAILSMWMQSSEWKNQQDIIKPMTPEMIQRKQAASQQAMQQSKGAVAQQSQDQKFQQKSQLEDQQNDNRIKRDLVRQAAGANAKSEALTGSPSETQGLGSQGEGTVV